MYKRQVVDDYNNIHQVKKGIKIEYKNDGKDKYFINGFGRLTKLFSDASGKFDYDGIDQGLVDGFGRVSGIAGKFLRNIQTGRLQNYLLFVVAGILVIIIAQAF